jgi:23S rRNA-/tRNA-specific pseudouridylate synthase
MFFFSLRFSQQKRQPTGCSYTEHHSNAFIMHHLCLYFCLIIVFGVAASFTFEIVHRFSIQPNQQNEDLTLSQALQDQGIFSSKSQVKLACQRGAILIRPANASSSLRNIYEYEGLLSSSLRVATSLSETVQGGDEICVQTRRSTDCYDVSVTKYILPPPAWSHFSNNKGEQDYLTVVYQDDYMAVVKKPENMTTIESSQARTDLQSILGFLLSPGKDVTYHPRPVHRLDRATTGLVLVAKTKQVMQYQSEAFRMRSIQKTYSAIVCPLNKDSQKLISQKGEYNWQEIDYPIDGKPALSSWRLVSQHEQFLLLEVRPHTGRTHQIRRHLAYCMDAPIVGDIKYDFGGSSRRAWRDNGMFLCCHSLEFSHFHYDVSSDNERRHRQQDNLSNSFPVVKVVKYDDDDHQLDSSSSSSSGAFRIQVSIPLPSKFHDQIVKYG